jgi:hypothetical protein
MFDNKTTIEDEIDAIRLKLYEQTKNMNYQEFITFIKRETEPINKQYGIKTISGIDEFIKNNNSK